VKILLGRFITVCILLFTITNYIIPTHPRAFFPDVLSLRIIAKERTTGFSILLSPLTAKLSRRLSRQINLSFHHVWIHNLVVTTNRKCNPSGLFHEFITDGKECQWMGSFPLVSRGFVSPERKDCPFVESCGFLVMSKMDRRKVVALTAIALRLFTVCTP
jgi:hypothetical protein